jgi:hypothetical protein
MWMLVIYTTDKGVPVELSVATDTLLVDILCGPSMPGDGSTPLQVMVKFPCAPVECVTEHQRGQIATHEQHLM